MEMSIKDFEEIIRNYKRAFQKCEVDINLKNENLKIVAFLLVFSQFSAGNPEIRAKNQSFFRRNRGF